MSVPKGLGAWIWLLDQLGSIESVVEKCHQLGISWLCIKAGERHRNEGDHNQWSPDKASHIIDVCHKSGIGIYTWHYSYPSAWVSESAMIKELFTQDIDGHFLDLEEPWCKGNNIDAAKHLCDSFQSYIQAGKIVAYAPEAYWEWHPMPYDVFANNTSFVSPQFYWTENKVGKYSDIAKDLVPMWDRYSKKYPNSAVLPIGVTYGKGDVKVRQQPPGVFIPDEFKCFLDTYDKDGISLYTLEAANKSALAVLQERADLKACK